MAITCHSIEKFFPTTEKGGEWQQSRGRCW